MTQLLAVLLLAIIIFLLNGVWGYRYVHDATVAQIANTAYSFLYFYKDNCRFCLQFEPTFEYLDGQLGRSGLSIYKVDGKANTQLTLMFKVDSFPSVRIYDINQMRFFVYNSTDRSIASLTEFIESYTPFKVGDFIPPLNVAYDTEKIIPNTIVFTTSVYFDDFKDPLHYIYNIAREFPDKKLCVNNIEATETTEWWKALGARTKFPSITVVDSKGRYRMLTGDHLTEDEVRKFISKSDKATDWTNVGESNLDEFEVDDDEEDLDIHDEL
ncbi:uncharacterized protein KQ657_003082 [Scheffersomyces spartinae]|uniref:Thioredoxin domain-containing protein n=1 Tax=Scheffersomyces spartinae TaxID=45513 RepID=A0A9P8AGW0_9ASCO|nr:uncharacterized protein KQ657_003082 [Scheffersomyces spartinae]KAG7191487.1 hypothetical protein KQ657_003082 [Scheffersomyces spartinae]